MYTNELSMTWYKSLTTHQKINIKEIFVLLCGIEWSAIAFLFSLKERIHLLHSKLIIEGFDI